MWPTRVSQKWHQYTCIAMGNSWPFRKVANIHQKKNTKSKKLYTEKHIQHTVQQLQHHLSDICVFHCFIPCIAQYLCWIFMFCVYFCSHNFVCFFLSLFHCCCCCQAILCHPWTNFCLMIFVLFAFCCSCVKLLILKSNFCVSTSFVFLYLFCLVRFIKCIWWLTKVAQQHNLLDWFFSGRLSLYFSAFVIIFFSRRYNSKHIWFLSYRLILISNRSFFCSIIV